MKKLLFLSILSLFTLTTFAQSKLATGTWRGKLKTASGNNLPFNFIVSDTAGKQQITVINGAERLKVTDVKTAGDSVFIHMPLFDSEFRLKLDGGGLTGQAEAIKLGISKILAQISEEQRLKLRHDGFLTRDAREVERKKPGLRKARKKEQFSKR